MAREFHSYGLGHMRMSDLPTSYGHMAVTLLTTFNSSTSLPGILTFSEVPQMAVRSRVQQQRVRCRALNRRDPSTIIPNTPTPAARAARTPNPTTDARCSFLACAGCGRRGWRRIEEQHGPRTSNLFVRPRPKPWAVLAGRTGAFPRGSAAFLRFRFANFCSRAPGTGVGGKARM